MKHQWEVERVARRIIEYRLPERFIVGTVGMPGERTFYLQAKSAGRTFCGRF